MDVGQQYRASATGAGTITALTCPATPAAQTIKGAAGRLLGLYLVNTNATIRETLANNHSRIPTRWTDVKGEYRVSTD
jgi:hypothetical protein